MAELDLEEECGDSKMPRFAWSSAGTAMPKRFLPNKDCDASRHAKDLDRGKGPTQTKSGASTAGPQHASPCKKNKLPGFKESDAGTANPEQANACVSGEVSELEKSDRSIRKPS